MKAFGALDICVRNCSCNCDCDCDCDYGCMALTIWQCVCVCAWNIWPVCDVYREPMLPKNIGNKRFECNKKKTVEIFWF